MKFNKSVLSLTKIYSENSKIGVNILKISLFISSLFFERYNKNFNNNFSIDFIFDIFESSSENRT